MAQDCALAASARFIPFVGSAEKNLTDRDRRLSSQARPVPRLSFE